MRLFTSRYQNKALADRADLVKVGITQGDPRFRLGYDLAANLRALAPPRSIWGLDQETFRTRYTASLDEIGVDGVRSMLERAGGGADVVLLCFEDLNEPGKFCHRRVFAEWWEEKTGEAVPELEAVRAQIGLL